jgi:hypothetical protein
VNRRAGNGKFIIQRQIATSLNIPGITNVTKPLVTPENVSLLLLDIKLSLMKNIVKSRDKKSSRLEISERQYG